MRILRNLSLGIAAAATIGGCGLLDPPVPDEARVVIEGPAGARARLLTSTRFVAGLAEDGGTRVVIVRSDTVEVDLPFESRHAIRADQRFFVQAEPLDEGVSGFRMRVFLDDRAEFDETGLLRTDAPFRFVYTFNQRWASVTDVVF
jgi:hypothetical protein